jgi:hypothetical protein
LGQLICGGRPREERSLEGSLEGYIGSEIGLNVCAVDRTLDETMTHHGAAVSVIREDQTSWADRPRRALLLIGAAGGRANHRAAQSAEDKATLERATRIDRGEPVRPVRGTSVTLLV